MEDEDLSAGLKGIDADGNGIRDDIDRLIAKKYSATPVQKRAAEQKARALQKYMEASTRREVLIAGDESRRAGECLYQVLLRGDSNNWNLYEQLSKEIEALTANTKERFEKYWKSNELAGGAVFSQPNGPACD